MQRICSQIFLAVPSLLYGNRVSEVLNTIETYLTGLRETNCQRDVKEMKTDSLVATKYVALTAVLSAIVTVVGIFALVPCPLPGVSVLYVAAAVEVVFPLWFGIWGVLADYIGGVLMGLFYGEPAHSLLWAVILCDVTIGLIPLVAFRSLKRDPELKALRDWAVYVVFGILLNNLISAMAGVGSSVAMGLVPSELYWPSVALWATGNCISTTIIATPLLRGTTKYIKKTPVYVKHWLK